MADQLNFQLPPTGFDSYLQGIIPENQAIAAGALSISLQQIRDITKVTTPEFAKIVYSMEGLKDLNLIPVNGTTANPDDKNEKAVPADQVYAKQAILKNALGTGPYGTYVMSNYYGAMTGLIYAWQNIYNGLKDLETKQLVTIYNNLYLATTWQQAIAQWDGTKIIFITRGGGYGRNGTTPTVTINGVPAKVTIGTDPTNLLTYGRIVSIDYTGFAGPVVISAPPGNGWPAMNEVVQKYIDEANTEIANIKNTTSVARIVNLLNAYWRITGIALKIEQRARFIALAPVPIPYDNRLADKPTTIVSWVDSLCGWSSETAPHMHVQTIENFCDMRTVGGQSVIALMRSCRNEARLSEIGLLLDNNIPSGLPVDQEKALISNGAVPTAPPGSGIESPCGLGTYTIPSTAAVTDPFSYTDANGVLHEITACKPGDITPILECDPFPIVNPCSPAGPAPEGPGTEGTLTAITEKTKPINPFVIDLNTFPPAQLNSDYTGTTLLPSIYNIDEAIAKVIECNCDCWIK